MTYVTYQMTYQVTYVTKLGHLCDICYLSSDLCDLCHLSSDLSSDLLSDLSSDLSSDLCDLCDQVSADDVQSKV